jgi:hypothetical protein
MAEAVNQNPPGFDAQAIRKLVFPAASFQLLSKHLALQNARSNVSV